MADTAGLLEKYAGAQSGSETSSAQFRQKLMSAKPEWAKFDATKGNAGILTLLDAETSAIKTKAIIQGHLSVLQACMDATTLQDVKPVQWILTVLYDILREDSSCYSLFEDGMNKNNFDFFKPLMALLKKKPADAYAADKAAWLLSALIGNIPLAFTGDNVDALLSVLLGSDSVCSEIGTLEAITNLLKSDVYRTQVWSKAGVADLVFKVEAKTSGSAELYRQIFAIWMISFEPEMIPLAMSSHNSVKKLQEALTHSRSEKVCRLCLTVLRNLLENKKCCEEIVEEGILDVVQQLEFEKWRDAELYDEIREVAQQICLQVAEMSNYDRYEKELSSGKLTWGFIHSAKFWAENVMKFERDDYRCVKTLAGLLQNCNTDPTTLAVACHDLGEFVALHPVGKKKVAQLGVKERVMQLMGSQDTSFREVRREALLCCQKIMLNNWVAMDKAAK